MKFLEKASLPVKRFGSRALFTMKKKSPEICLVLGLGTGAAAVVMGCRATLKADTVLDQYSETKEKIEEAKRVAESGEVEGIVYSETDYKRDKAIAFRDLIFGMGKLYWPTILLEATSIALILTSYKIINGRFVGLMGAYTALDDGFKKYRARVAEAVGPEKEMEIRTGVAPKKGYVKEKNDVGEDKVVEKTVDQRDGTLDTDGLDYGGCFIFSEHTSKEYQRHDPVYNESFLKAQETYFKNVLASRGYVFMSEVKRALGMKILDNDFISGWILDPACPHEHPELSFGIRGPIFRETGDHVMKTGRIVKELSGKEYLLDFNCDGVIWNLVHLWEH